MSIEKQEAVPVDVRTINPPRTGPSVLLPPRPLPLLLPPFARGGGQPKVKLGELCILGDGVWLLLLLWLLHRIRFRAFSEAEPDRQLGG